jgi:hypothetical protein
MLKKTLLNLVLSATLASTAIVSTTANAGLMDAFEVESGVYGTLLSGDTSVDLVPPVRVSEAEGKYSGLFVNSSSYTLDSILTTGGVFNFTEFWDFANGPTPLFLSLTTTYGVDSWLHDLMLTAGNGDQITDIFNISGTSILAGTTINDNLTFHGAITNYKKVGENGAADIFYSGFEGFYRGVADTNTSVPEPSTLAIFALGVMGLVSRRTKKV